MKKKITMLCITVLALFTSVAQAQQQESQEELVHDALLSTLYPHISKAVNDYYKKVKQFMDTKIIDIKRLGESQYSFVVKVQLTTFEHAHNPPYGTDTITLEVEPSKVKVTNYEHKGDEWEQKIKKFQNDVLMDIQKSFNLNLNAYQKYGYRTLEYLASSDGNHNQLYTIVTDIVKELHKERQAPYRNVVAPFTFIRDNQGYILFKKADGTNFVYTLSKENGTWKIVKKETKQGKVMPKELLWYMMFKQTS